MSPVIGTETDVARRSSTITTIPFDDFDSLMNAIQVSSAIAVGPFRHFTLYLDVDSTGTGAHIIRFIVQFSNDGGTTWFDYKQGLFASLYYEDQDTAGGIKECFSGECAGRHFRLRAVAEGVTSTLYFTVTAYVEFWS